MTPYAGNPDSFPVSVDIPSDADPPAAATFNVALEGLADRTECLANQTIAGALANIAALQAVNTTGLPNGAVRFVTGLGRYMLDTVANPTFPQDLPLVVQPTTGPGRWYAQDVAAKKQYSKTFTAGATWTCPPNLSMVEVIACGGGGGGGGGGGASTLTALTAGGGGGMGGKLTRQLFSPVALKAYTVIAAPGGAGGAAGANGSDGGNSGLTDPVGPTIVVEALGGQGGAAPLPGVNTAGLSYVGVVPGGSSPSGSPKPVSYFLTVLVAPTVVERGGGYSTTVEAYNFSNGPTAGGNSSEGGSGGLPGSTGGGAGGHGGGGGGGGAGPFLGATGGNGGDGGAYNGGGVGANGNPGNAPASATSYGAGGGGGGGGGQGTTAGSLGAAGGAGNGGVVMIVGVY